ncbi:unnamed protein product [Ceratitis capitata]|uniref:(Mediterranean fruit fly) hypothetical protein n=1 Tax=Ceratitis capitata TaxID=7213 RepID=A0A811UIQ8_CERCA|nr:unnamed protein product [Ceratitis capitata]
MSEKDNSNKPFDVLGIPLNQVETNLNSSIVSTVQSVVGQSNIQKNKSQGDTKWEAVKNKKLEQAIENTNKLISAKTINVKKRKQHNTQYDSMESLVEVQASRSMQVLLQSLHDLTQKKVLFKKRMTFLREIHRNRIATQHLNNLMTRKWNNLTMERQVNKAKNVNSNNRTSSTATAICIREKYKFKLIDIGDTIHLESVALKIFTASDEKISFVSVYNRSTDVLKCNDLNLLLNSLNTRPKC